MFGFLFAVAVCGADPADNVGRVVAELRSQDSAFALTIQAYREIQTFMIERDYEARLKAGASHNAPSIRQEVARLAALERNLRLQKLDANVANLRTTYDHARRLDEVDAGVTVPANSDTTAAAKQLHEMVFIAPPLSGQPGVGSSRSIPVNSVLSPMPEEAYLNLLRQSTGQTPALGEAVRSLLAASPTVRPVLMQTPPVVGSYRQEGEQVTGVVVQGFQPQTGPPRRRHLKATGLLDDDALARVEELFDRAAETSFNLGEPAEVRQRLQLWRDIRGGDFRELAAGARPSLRVAILLPDAQQLLPRSLGAHIHAVSLLAEFDSKEWRGSIHFFARDADGAARASQTGAAWQLLAESFVGLAEIRAGMRECIRSATVAVNGEMVSVSGSLPAVLAEKLAQRVATKFQGLGAPANVAASELVLK